jgi:ABC-type sugar transport system ATPase subunit
MSFIDGAVVTETGTSTFTSERGQVRVPLGRTATAGKAKLGIRSEYLHDDPAGPLVGKVVMDEYLGSARSVHVEGEWGRVVMRAPAEAAHPAGTELRLGLDLAHACLFDATTEKRL